MAIKLWSFINEENLAKELLNNKNKINDNTRERLISYIKYLKHEGLNKTNIRNEIDTLMLNHYIGFVMGDWDERLQRYVNKYTKNENCEYKSEKEILISKQELEFIKTIGAINNISPIEIEKILFCMLVLGKSTYKENDEFIWCNYDSNVIFRLARFKYKHYGDGQLIQRENLIYDLKNHSTNIFETVGTNLKLLFADTNIKEENIALKLTYTNFTAESMIVDYLNWRKLDGYYYCRRCGRGIIKKCKNSRQHYCTNCSKEITKEKDRLRKRTK